MNVRQHIPQLCQRDPALQLQLRRLPPEGACSGGDVIDVRQDAAGAPQLPPRSGQACGRARGVRRAC